RVGSVPECRDVWRIAWSDAQAERLPGGRDEWFSAVRSGIRLLVTCRELGQFPSRRADDGPVRPGNAPGPGGPGLQREPPDVVDATTFLSGRSRLRGLDRTDRHHPRMDVSRGDSGGLLSL